MKNRKTFFVLKCAEHDGEWHFRCIDCSETDANNQLQNQSWDLVVLNENRCITLGYPPEQSYIDNLSKDPIEVYEIDPLAISIAPVKEKPQLLVAQNYKFLLTEQNCNDIIIPCFISVVSTVSIHNRVIMEFETGMVKDLPEVRIYEQRMQNSKFDHDQFWSMLNTVSGNTYRIPEGLFLPASIESGSGNKSPGVYRIEKWLSEKTAIVECHQADDSVPFATGSKLTRRVFTPNGEEFSSEIGTVLEVK